MKTIGPYEIEGEIGRGGAAVVYRAQDTNVGRTVAIKHFREEASELWRKRFQREAQVLARFRHPNIVGVHDIGEFEGRPYLVMELVEGGCIDIDADLKTVIPMLRKVALAVEEIHRNGIVHRDLKPANILVDAAGEPRVVDFGLVHLIDPDLKLTRTMPILRVSLGGES